MAQDLTDAELDELATLLAAGPPPLQPLDVPRLDGYLAGVLVQTRLVPLEEWLPPVFDEPGSAWPPPNADAAWLARTCTLIERRHAAINAQISEDGFFDPVTIDAETLPPASEYESPISRVLAPWVEGFEFACECFPALEEEGGDEVALWLARFKRHLPTQNDEDRRAVAEMDRLHPLKDLDAAIADLVDTTVALWDATAERRYAVAPIRRAAPKVGRNDPCPCGSGRKYKVCCGR